MKFLLGWLFLLSVAQAKPEFTQFRTWLHVNGYTYHFAAPGANDRLLGVGFTRYMPRRHFVIRAWEGDLFQDSGRRLSGYVGQSWTVPTRLVSLGLTGAVMYHRNFASHNRLWTLPVAFPFLEAGGPRVKARLYYVIPARRASDQQVALQLMLPWSFRGKRDWSHHMGLNR